MTPVDTLRAELAELEQAHDAVIRRLSELDEQREALPDFATAQMRLCSAWRLFRMTSIGTVVVVVTILVVYALAFGPGPSLDETDLTRLRDSADRTIAMAADAGLPETSAEDMNELVRVKQDAEYSVPVTIIAGRTPYRGLRRLDVSYSEELDPAFRWAHIGAAACKVGQSKLATHALRVLTWQADVKGPDGLPFEDFSLRYGAQKPDRRIAKIQAATLAQCLFGSDDTAVLRGIVE